MKMSLLALLLSGLAFLGAGCGDSSKPQVEPSVTADSGKATPAADYLLANGKIFTVDPQQPWAEAVAVKGNEIIFVGSTADAQELIGENTKVADLGGRMVMPGIIETHLHTMLASIAGSGLRVTSTTMDETGLSRSVLKFSERRLRSSFYATC